MKTLSLSFGIFWLFIVGFMAWFGAWCVNYTFLHTIHKTIPFIWALIITVFTGDLSLITAFVVKTLIMLGILA